VIVFRSGSKLDIAVIVMLSGFKMSSVILKFQIVLWNNLYLNVLAKVNVSCSSGHALGSCPMVVIAISGVINSRSYITPVTLTVHSKCDYIKFRKFELSVPFDWEDEMDGACNTQGRDEKFIQSFCRKT
jgi:hypothetical protein